MSGSPASHDLHGSLDGCLEAVREWLGRFIVVSDERDLDLVTLWAAHTHVAMETHTTPRLIIDSVMYGAGKTTLLEHLQRLTNAPVQAASISSPALLARMLDKAMRTVLIDEADRSLDPKKTGVEELFAIINSGYKRGGTRPVLVPTKGGGWDVEEMTTFSPVAMAGNSPNLPDDTRSRCIRIVLMPDLAGRAEESAWEDIEADAVALGVALAEALDGLRSAIASSRPPLSSECRGRCREKWSPLARVADLAGGRWPSVVADLIARDIEEVAMEREEGLLNRPPAVVLITDLHAVWRDGETFVPTVELVARLIGHNPSYWGDASAYGRALTTQRLGRLLVQAFKIKSAQLPYGVSRARGYARAAFGTVWRALGIEPCESCEEGEPPRAPSPAALTSATESSLLAQAEEAFTLAKGRPMTADERAVHARYAPFVLRDYVDIYRSQVKTDGSGATCPQHGIGLVGRECPACRELVAS